MASLDTGTASGWSFPHGYQWNAGSWSTINNVQRYQFQVRGTVVPDTTVPTLDTEEVNGDTLTLTCDEALDEDSTSATSAFTIGGTTATVSTVAASGMEVILTLSSAVSAGDSVTVSYTAPGTDPLKDVARNNAANLMTRMVTNTTFPSVSIIAGADATLA